MKNLKNFQDFILNEKYQNTELDKADDLKLIKIFATKFEDKFQKKLNLKVSRDAEFRDYLGYGADKIYTSETNITDDKFDSVNDKAYIWITTDINPNGIKDKQYGRTFTIDYELKGEKTSTYTDDETDETETYTDDVMVKKFYNYSTDMDEVLENFEYFINTKL